MKATVKRALNMFGELAKAEIAATDSKFVVVSLDDVSDDVHAQRVAECDPNSFFKCTCPQCQPFIKDGAYMVYTETDVLGCRTLPNGMYEVVMLTGNKEVGKCAN